MENLGSVISTGDDRLLSLLQQLVQPSFDALMLASLSEIFISVIALSNSDD